MQDNNNKSYTLTQTYRYFINNNKEGITLSEKKYRDICKKFNEFIVEEMYKGRTINLKGLGRLYIRKKIAKENKRFIDFKKTQERGKTSYHLNLHSSGYYYKFEWNKTGLKGIKAWQFNPTRTNKRTLAKKVKNKNIAI